MFCWGRTAVCVAAFLSVIPAAAQVRQERLRIRVLDGQGAINSIRDRHGRDIAVRVEDDDHRPLAGAVVTFQAPDMGPSGVFAAGERSVVVHTDSDGAAIARALRSNNIAGAYQIRVTASHEGETATALIDQTNVAPVRSGSNAKKLMVLGIIAGAAAGGALAASRGGNGQAAVSPATPAAQAPPSPGTVVTPGSPSFGPPR